MSSDHVVIDVVVDHLPHKVWQLVGYPVMYPRFFRGIGQCERLGGAPGARARYLFTVCGSDGAASQHTAKVLIAREAEKLVLHRDPDDGSWVSIAVSNAGAGRTRLKVVFVRPRAEVEQWARDGIRRMVNYLSGSKDSVVVNRGEAGGYQLNVARTLMRAGVLSARQPHRGIKQLKALAQWGHTLVGGYAQAAARSPEDIALIDLHGTKTFRELDEISGRLAAGLNRLAVGPGSVVGVMARNHTTMVEALVACSKLGATVVLINTAIAAQQVVDAVADHGVSSVLYDEEFASAIQYLPPRVGRICTSWLAPRTGYSVPDLLRHAGDTTLPRPKRPSTFIVMTSGTSGAPKGAKRPTPKGLGTVAAMLSRLPLRVGERMLIAAPLFHSWGFAALQISTPLRATVVLRERFDAEDCLRAIAAHRCTALFAIPIMLKRILDLPPAVRANYDTSSLRVVASSGSAMSGAMVTEFMATFGDILYNFYGSTEVSWGTVAGPDDLRASPTTAGRPPLGTRLAVLDGDGEPVPVGATGRIFVGNDMLFDGYTDGGKRQVKDSLMDTGDLGYLDADGRLCVSGRQDEMIISGGENVFPRPVEEALAFLPQVKDVAVVGVPDVEFGQRLAAYVVLRDGARLDADLVRAYIKHRLPKFAIPRDVTFLDELPRNPTGKILKRLLVERQWLGGTAA